MAYRPLYQIAQEIRNDWSKQGKGVNYAARPYLDAMFSLDKMTDMYGADNAKTIVIYFLANAQSWKGEVAKRVKKELNLMYKNPLAESIKQKKIRILKEMLEKQYKVKVIFKEPTKAKTSIKKR